MGPIFFHFDLFKWDFNYLLSIVNQPHFAMTIPSGPNAIFQSCLSFWALDNVPCIDIEPSQDDLHFLEFVLCLQTNPLTRQCPLSRLDSVYLYVHFEASSGVL